MDHKRIMLASQLWCKTIFTMEDPGEESIFTLEMYALRTALICGSIRKMEAYILGLLEHFFGPKVRGVGFPSKWKDQNSNPC